MVEERVYELDKSEKKQLDELLAADPYAPVSFARVSPQLKEVEGKLYIYIKAEDDFFKFAEEKLKTLSTAKRSPKNKEDEIIELIHTEEETAAGGFGGIFGE